MDTDTLDYVMKCLAAIVVLCSIWGGLGYYVARQCGRNFVEGFVLGFLFGPFGAILVALLPRGDK
jgi:hypothetical protein